MLAAFVSPISKRLTTLSKENVRTNLGGICGAAGAAIYLTSPSLASFWTPLGFVLFWVALLFIGWKRPAWPVMVGAGVIVGSALVACFISWQFASDTNLAGTIILAVLTLALAPLAWLKTARPILQWITPVWVAHATVSLYQWLALDIGRATGLTNNANVGAAFLLLGCVYLSNGNSRIKWLILPLIAAMPFTGSRWIIIVAAGITIALFASKYVPVKYLAMGMAVALIAVSITGWSDIIEMFSRESTLSIHIGGYSEQPDLPVSWIPRGFYNSGIHIVPWRMMHETGIASGLAWIGLSVWRLWRRDKTTEWWLMLTVVGISVMYYNTWIGPLGWFWWALMNTSNMYKPLK